MIVHLFYDDWLIREPFQEELEDYTEAVEAATVVGTYCGKELSMADDNWTYQHEFTTCEDCKDDYALSLLAILP